MSWTTTRTLRMRLAKERRSLQHVLMYAMIAVVVIEKLIELEV